MATNKEQLKKKIKKIDSEIEQVKNELGGSSFCSKSKRYADLLSKRVDLYRELVKNE